MMTSETKRNFTIGGIFFVAILAIAVYSKWKPTGCAPDAPTVLAVVDFTDPMGDDARARLKDAVWAAIERAPQRANVVLRAITGKDDAGKQIVVPPTMMCRPEKPSIVSGFTGPTKKLEQEWQTFKNQVCGMPPDSNAANVASLACGDFTRQGSFFEQKVKKSNTSPIAEQVLDSVRRHLPPEVKSWQLIVASDWREYNPPAFNVETIKCNEQTDSTRLNQMLLVGEREKLLVGSGDASANNSVESILVLRSNMTQDEADCLEKLADGFFRLNMASPPPTLTSTRLSVTGK